MASASRYVFFGAEREPSLLYEDGQSIPEIQEGEILAKIRLATICGSDLHTIAGKRREVVPSVLGHEAVAEVITTRRDDQGVKVGDRVTFSIVDSCNKCASCRHDLPQKCHHLKKYGHMSLTDHGAGFNGCFASHIVLRPGTAVFPIPDQISDRVAAPLNCALATMVNAVSTIPAPPDGQGVALIQGAGLLGLYGCALLRERGFTTVWCTDVNHQRLLMVPRFGGMPLNPNGAWGSGPEANSVDAVVEACGQRSVVAAGLSLLRPGGTYALVGLVHPDSHLDITAEAIIRKCLTIKGIHNYAPSHLEEAVRFVVSTADKYPYESLVSTEVPLKDLPSALSTANTQHYIRVAVRP